MRVFGFTIARASAPRTPPAQTTPPLSGFLVGESKADRIERVAADATELLRRAYAGHTWSRRTMQPLGIGARRWGSAWAFLCHAAVIRPDGTLIHADQVMARRSLAACRDHHLAALRHGDYAPPF